MAHKKELSFGNRLHAESCLKKLMVDIGVFVENQSIVLKQEKEGDAVEYVVTVDVYDSDKCLGIVTYWMQGFYQGYLVRGTPTVP